MTEKHWTVLSEDSVFAADPYVTVTKQRVKLPDGVEIPDFYQVYLRHFAIVVPITDDGQVVFVEGYRHGSRSVELSFPGGFLEPNAPAETAVARELLEETGYACRELKELGTTFDNGNQRGCQGTFFVGVGAHKIGDTALDVTEDFTCREVSVSDIDDLLRRGQMKMAHSVVGLAHARLHIEI